MKFLHVSDIHLGKRLYGCSLHDDHAHILGQILAAMVLMGSIYVGSYLTWLLLVSVVTGLCIGGLCDGILRALRPMKLGGEL